MILESINLILQLVHIYSCLLPDALDELHSGIIVVRHVLRCELREWSDDVTYHGGVFEWCSKYHWHCSDSADVVIVIRHQDRISWPRISQGQDEAARVANLVSQHPWYSIASRKTLTSNSPVIGIQYLPGPAVWTCQASCC